MSQENEGRLLHDQEGPADRVHLSRVRVALPLHLKDMVDLQQVFQDQGLQDLTPQLAEGE